MTATRFEPTTTQFINEHLDVGSNPVTVTLLLNIPPVSSKDFLNIQAITECRFTLNAYVICKNTANIIIIL